MCRKIFNVKTKEECKEVLRPEHDSWEWIDVGNGLFDLKFTTKPIPAVRPSHLMEEEHSSIRSLQHILDGLEIGDIKAFQQ